MSATTTGSKASAKRRVARTRRHLRLRKKIRGSAARPRLVVTRSTRHVYAQVVDDVRGVTLASASTYGLENAFSSGVDRAMFGYFASKRSAGRVITDEIGRASCRERV